MPKRELKGQVVSDKMKKTVVVKIETIKEHPKYKKRYKSHKKYKAHNSKLDLKVGDRVVIRECTPISKDKKWEVILKL
jgi:small subunit ribosomal protein S17